MEIQNDNFVIKLLISNRWKFFRHLLLGILSLSIAFGLTWHMQSNEQITSPIERTVSLLLFLLFFLGGCYLNIYVLTPRLLLRNRWNLYFFTLLGFVIIIMGAIVLIQLICSTNNQLEGHTPSILEIVVNLLSSTSSIFLLFVGTTTLVLFKYWILDVLQSEELESATLQLELKSLENQINPHFLFNMLNNANIMIKKDPDVASHIIVKLEDLLRYQINDRSHEKVCLNDEIFFLNDFLALEKTRRDYFSYTILKEGDTSSVQIYRLLFITFVEKAVKHSQDSQMASYINIVFRVEKGRLYFTCENSLSSSSINNQTGGLGLANVKQRLDLLYKNHYSLEYKRGSAKYIVKLELKL